MITSSLDLPELDPVLGWTDRIASSISNVSFWELVIWALSWRPNAYGEGFNGNFSMYSIYCSILLAEGCLYIPDFENA